MKRRWRIVLMRKTGEVLGTVEAADAQAAEKVAAIQFELEEGEGAQTKAPPERGSGANVCGSKWGLPPVPEGRRHQRQAYRLNAEPHHRLHSAGETCAG